MLLGLVFGVISSVLLDLSLIDLVNPVSCPSILWSSWDSMTTIEDEKVFFFFFQFSYNCFKIYFFNIYTSPTFLSPLPFHLPTTSSIFLSPLPFHLPTTLYINIILPLSLHLPLFLSLLIHTLLL